MALDMKKRVKYVDVRPGSKVLVHSSTEAYAPYEASVIEMRPEYGPHRIPALVLNRGDNEPEVLLADGTSWVDIVLDSKALQQQAPPPGTIEARSIPIRVQGLQFTGGAENATRIIVFTAGLMSVRWNEASEAQPEHLLITTLEGTTIVPPGGYVVRSVATEEVPTVKAWTETQEGWIEKYEFAE